MSVINITDKSNASIGKAMESMPFGPTQRVPKPSNEYPGNSNQIGTGTQGRNQALLELAFPSTTLGLDSYDPVRTYQTLMQGDSELALGAAPADGAEQYVGANHGTDYLTYAQSPNLSDVDVATLGVINPFVPDVSIGRANRDDLQASFEAKYSGNQNSFPAGNIDTGLDLSPGVPSNDPSFLSPHNTKTRVGDWLSPSFGRWRNDGNLDRS